MRNPLRWVNKYVWKLSPPYFNLFMRLLTVIMIITAVAFGLTFWYVLRGGDLTAILGGIIVNLFTIVLILGFIDRITNIIKIRLEIDTRDYEKELSEKSKQEENSD